MIFEKAPDDFKPQFEVSGVYVKCGEEFLWLQRPGTAKEPFKWSCPGGLIDPGETPVQAGIRELAEETGIVVDVLQELPVLYIQYPYHSFVFHRFLLLLQEKPTIVLDPNEHQASAWFRPDESVDLLPSDRYFVDHL